MSKNVLICDDSVLMRRMLAEALAAGGWTVVAEAANGREAIDRYAEFRPDAVTMDLVMPDSDGLFGLRGIKQLDASAKVVVVSAVNQSKLIAEAIHAGAHDFIAKPFLPPQLVETMASCLV